MYNRIGKRLRISLAVAVIALVGLFGAQTGEAQTMAPLPAPMTPAETLGDARPLLAWIDFCRRHPSECTVVKRPRFVRHRIESYAARAAGESWFCRTAAGV
jgi:predicted transglutaminase-like cysteine proteinase